jgi:hypothetical protein
VDGFQGEELALLKAAQVIVESFDGTGLLEPDQEAAQALWIAAGMWSAPSCPPL